MLWSFGVKLMLVYDKETDIPVFRGTCQCIIAEILTTQNAPFCMQHSVVASR